MGMNVGKVFESIEIVKKMRKIYIAWNFLYYSMYVFVTKCFTVVNRHNIFNIFTETTYFKKAAKKSGIDDFSDYMHDTMNNKETGMNLTLVNSLFSGFTTLFVTSIYFVVELLLHRFIKVNLVSAMFVIVPCVIVLNNKIIFNNNIYLKYFKIFSRYDRPKKRKYFLLSLAFIIFSLLFFFFSMIVNLIGGAILQ